jgi:hypothetical protein
MDIATAHSCMLRKCLPTLLPGNSYRGQQHRLWRSHQMLLAWHQHSWHDLIACCCCCCCWRR